jgi:hypothetical protein
VDIADLAVITSKVDKAVTLAKMADATASVFIEKLRLQVFLKCRHWLLLKQILV